MFSLVYTSLACKPVDRKSVELLLEHARSRNAALGITGMLLYDNGVFLQVLEGEESNVEEVFASIERDSRHEAVAVLGRVEVPAREFASWTMAYSDLAEAVTSPDGHESGSLRGMNLNAARQYLRFFRPDSPSLLSFALG